MTPDGPACPECSEPVGAVAGGCVNCGATLDPRDDGVVETAVVDFGDDPDAGGSDGGGPAGPDRLAALRDRLRPDGLPGAGRDWLHPESALDDLSTGAVAVGAALVVGFLAMVLVLFTTGSPWGFLVGPVVAVSAGLHVGRTWTVFGAVRKACYLIAPTLVAVPVFWFGEAPQGGSFGGRVVAFVVSEAVVLPVALVLVGVGYWVGRKAPD